MPLEIKMDYALRPGSTGFSVSHPWLVGRVLITNRILLQTQNTFLQSAYLLQEGKW